MSKKILVGATALASALVVAPAAGAAVTVTFSNPAPITINDATVAGAPVGANPYPSTLTVPAVPALPISGSRQLRAWVKSVTLHGVTHSSPADIDAKLTGPAAATVLLDNAGGTSPVSDATLNFESNGASPVPFAGPMTSGTFRPSEYSESGVLSMRRLFSYQPGVWSLYVADDDPGDTGVVARGYSVTLTYEPNNVFKTASAKLDRKRGTATLPVTVPNPGLITLKNTRTVRGLTVNAPAAGVYELKIKAKGRALRRLKRKGKVAVNAVVSYVPVGGTVTSATRSVPLRIKAHKKKRKEA